MNNIDNLEIGANKCNQFVFNSKTKILKRDTILKQKIGLEGLNINRREKHGCTHCILN